VGKTTLGRKTCQELGLELLELGAAPVPREASSAALGPRDSSGAAPEPPDASAGPRAALDRLSRAIAERAADVIEIPWELQQERKALALLRRAGQPLYLWAHPEDMQARSGRAEPLFTPVRRLKTRGGFGRNGTSCREFRYLKRACEDGLRLVDLSIDQAAELLRDALVELREEGAAPPAEREGIADWEQDWRDDHGASARVARVILDAMARYLLHLRQKGTSPRTLSGVRSDLHAAGQLVFMYDAPRGGDPILESFSIPPWDLEFRRKFTDSPSLVARYCRNLDGFARFLRDQGELPPDDE